MRTLSFSSARARDRQALATVLHALRSVRRNRQARLLAALVEHVRGPLDCLLGLLLNFCYRRSLQGGRDYREAAILFRSSRIRRDTGGARVRLQPPDPSHLRGCPESNAGAEHLGGRRGAKLVCDYHALLSLCGTSPPSRRAGAQDQYRAARPLKRPHDRQPGDGNGRRAPTRRAVLPRGPG